MKQSGFFDVDKRLAPLSELKYQRRRLISQNMEISHYSKRRANAITATVNQYAAAVKSKDTPINQRFFYPSTLLSGE
ncbi:hypothetical protein [Gluconobacter wancherniae]|uniref:Uncharacterized protein n=1 Tax=Gluconobacter wancherniae NBRC 103581 TaxID=656744 RepID=A0A511AXV4_9PROT|nr:hypothetical protein [Gluconobacter wancherniae]MBF0853218.1 hypothetical protein [Gluconobacter wancherniae]GBD56058.1 hypothetical protein NBRC103581_00631 [Gluconobacter wancherniae NBRC 103581]GBR63120.1 hypothetical protein AA103581_0650 [Gluconobacter wancherniae NBRC 103581]GEK93038.1 hypothetical protein GWA01_08080 [Gluconobacter wancherniae NBRC 103581]